MAKIYALIQDFKFNMYENYEVKFECKPQHRTDAIFAQIGQKYSSFYECIIDKNTGDILEAWESGDFHYKDKKDKVNNLFGICGYTKEKLIYIADFIYNLGDFNCHPYMCGRNHNDSVAARLI
jgi:hypothetical protein